MDIGGAVCNFVKQVYRGVKKIPSVFDLDEYRRRHNPDLACFSDPQKIYYAMKKFLPLKGRTALDIGSNTGQYLSLFAPRFNKIIAFEPSKEAFEELKIRSGKYANVEIINKGALDFNGTILVYKHENSWKRKEVSIMEKGNEGFGWGQVTEELKIDVVKIDSLNIREIEFIKIDVEGAELKVLEGSLKTINEFRPKIFIEVHEESLGNKVMQLLDRAYAFKIVRHPAYRPKTSLWRNHYFLFAVARK